MAQSISNEHNLTAATESTMLKNDQWGAIAYLTTSNYGKFGKDAAPVYMNDCGGAYADSNGRTGWSSGAVTSVVPLGCKIGNNDLGAYHTTRGQTASTTGSVYGIYDMSGGAYERIMGNHNDTIIYSGFSSMPDAKYYNKYPASVFSNNHHYFDNSNCTWTTCGGHALHETKTKYLVDSDNQSWDLDTSVFVNGNNTWFDRGGSFFARTFSGIFAVTCDNGSTTSVSFRVVLGRF
jgi:hypothetical protein